MICPLKKLSLKRKSKRKNLNTLDVDKDAPLKGKILIQMFEKPSLRTRLSFYLAIRQLGGGTITLRSNELHLGKGGESLADTAKILSTYGDGFMLRTDSDKKINEVVKYMKIPFINGLSPSSHPTQILSDIFTVEEIKKKPISKLNICWIGDSNNVLNSLIAASVKFSFKLNIGCPKNYKPKKIILDWGRKNKKSVHIYNDPKKAVKNADVIFSDKVISLNDKVNVKKKKSFFKNFKIDNKLIKFAKKNALLNFGNSGTLARLLIGILSSTPNIEIKILFLKLFNLNFSICSSVYTECISIFHDIVVLRFPFNILGAL